MRLKQTLFIKLYIASALIIPCFGVSAQDLEFESGKSQIELLELFTSEGCSSCPPADRWLNNFINSPELWKSVVPIAFHVDYWDYIGWDDRFAKPEFSQRQRTYAKEFGEPTVYTPGVRRAGYEWQGWRRDPMLRSFPSTKAVSAGNLTAVLSSLGEISATFISPYDNDARNHQLNIAILGMGLESEVKRGENRGKTLKHNFVVLSLTPIEGKQEVETFRWRTQLPMPKIKAPGYAVALWVTREGSQRPIQVVGRQIPREHPLYLEIDKAL